MCITLSFTSKPGIGACNGRLQVPKSMLATARAQVISAPKIPVAFPGMTKQCISDMDLGVHEIVRRQSWPNNLASETGTSRRPRFNPMFLNDAYDKCRTICAEYAKTYYLGTLLMTKERQKAIWAIYVWCRRTDELVDGPNADYMSSAVLEGWEERLEDIFEGRPYDMLDAALSDTVFSFPWDIKGHDRGHENGYKEITLPKFPRALPLLLLCSRNCRIDEYSGYGNRTGILCFGHTIYNAALNLGIGNQLTNILRDVGEDASRGRVYLPQDELQQFGLSDKDVLSRKVTDSWREFMKEQIVRARFFFNLAEEGASQLHKDSRWPVWSSLILYRKILDAIEENDYDNLKKQAYVGRTKKLLSLPLAYTRALPEPGLSLR